MMMLLLTVASCCLLYEAGVSLDLFVQNRWYRMYMVRCPAPGSTSNLQSGAIRHHPCREGRSGYFDVVSALYTWTRIIINLSKPLGASSRCSEEPVLVFGSVFQHVSQALTIGTVVKTQLQVFIIPWLPTCTVALRFSALAV
ncbi:hypothetical protein GGR57DRAFT_462142 [Xylariaceae sp. FL1272]|nr:hypothetical protein GGR57DRAFT_462142 [Xylariaceae sp. FL1272]